MAEVSARHHTEFAPAFHVHAVLIGIAAWIVPGLGHVILRRWISGMVIFASIVALAITGDAMHGYIFSRRPGGDFDSLGYLASLGSGSLYFVARRMAGADLSRTAGDSGTRFLITAGVANLLCVLDAVKIALGEEQPDA